MSSPATTDTSPRASGARRPSRARPGPHGRAVLLVLASAFSIQFGAAFAAQLFPRVGPVGAVTLRIVIAAGILLAVARPALRGRTREDWSAAVGLGVMFAGMNLCFYEAIARLPLGPAVTLEFLGPLGLAVALSRRARDLMWIGFAAVGVLLLGRGGFGDLDPVGVAFVLAAAGCWAGYIVVASKASRRFDGLEGLALGFTVAAVLVLPFGIAGAGTALLDPGTLGIGAGVALLSSALPYSFEMLAMRHLPPATFGLLASLEPAVAALAGLAVLGQSLHPVEVCGILLVVIASAGVTVSGRRGGPPADDAGEPRRRGFRTRPRNPVKEGTSGTAAPGSGRPPAPDADASPTRDAARDVCEA